MPPLDKSHISDWLLKHRCTSLLNNSIIWLMHTIFCRLLCFIYCKVNFAELSGVLSVLIVHRSTVHSWCLKCCIALFLNCLWLLHLRKKRMFESFNPRWEIRGVWGTGFLACLTAYQDPATGNLLCGRSYFKLFNSIQCRKIFFNW